MEESEHERPAVAAGSPRRHSSPSITHHRGRRRGDGGGAGLFPLLRGQHPRRTRPRAAAPTARTERERPPHPQRGTAPNRPAAPPRDRAAHLPPDKIMARRGLARGALNARRTFNNGAHAATHSPPLLLWRRATRAGRRGRGGQRTATKGTAHTYAPNSPRRDTRTIKGGGSTPPPRAPFAREALSSRGGYRRERRLSIAQISKSRM